MPPTKQLVIVKWKENHPLLVQSLWTKPRALRQLPESLYRYLKRRKTRVEWKNNRNDKRRQKSNFSIAILSKMNSGINGPGFWEMRINAGNFPRSLVRLSLRFFNHVS